MLRKSKRFYAEEEIIDGFSILGFHDFKNLKKFCNSLKSNIRNSRLNNFSKTISIDTTKNSISSKKVTKEHFESKVPLVPARITSQRRSKPDISILSLSKQKRRVNIPRTYPTFIETMKDTFEKNVPEDNDQENIIHVKDDSVMVSLKSEDLGEQIVEDCNADTLEVHTEGMDKNGECIEDECSSNPHKEGSFIEDYTVANSTLSPGSFQPINSLQLAEESFDFDSIEKDIPMDSASSQGCIKSDIVEEIIETKEVVNDDDDCLIISVGFDPAPKLLHIPITISEASSEGVPQLKPAPSVIFSVSNLNSVKKAIIIPTKTVNILPPPLIPAPSQYFTILQSEHSPSISSVSSNQIFSPKYRSRKRCQMKSSILKPPSKSIKPSPTSPSSEYRSYSNFSNNGTDIIKSLLLNNFLPNTKIYSVPAQPLRQNVSAPALLSSLSSLHSRSNLLPSFNFELRLPRPISTDSNVNTNSNPNQSTNHINGPPGLIRKTICHVHIAQSIHQKLSTNQPQSHYSQTNITDLTKPRIFRPIPQCARPSQQYTTFKINDVLSPCPTSVINRPMPRLCYPKKSVHSLNAMSDLPVLIRPYNKTSLLPADFSPRHSMNTFQRHKVLLLKH